MQIDFNGKYKFLSENEFEAIHRNSLKVLEEVGIHVPNVKFLKKLEQGGCMVNYETSVVKMPAEVVEHSLKISREKLRKDEAQSEPYKKDLRIRGRVKGSSVNVLDWETNIFRPALMKDLHESMAIANRLECVSVYMPMFLPQDVPYRLRDVHQLNSCLRYNEKPLGYIDKMFPEYFEYAHKLGSIALGNEKEMHDKGFFDYCCFTSSPLRFSEEALDMALVAIEYGGFVHYATPMTVMGANVPGTVSGGVMLSNAEMLAGIVVGACMGNIQTGYYIIPLALDMKTGMGCYGDPRKLLACCAGMDLARYYGLGCWDFHVGVDAAGPGIQATAEKMLAAMLYIFLADSQPMMRMGVLGPAGNAASVLQMVIDAELCDMINNYLKGIIVDEDRIGFDTVKEVGIGGNFLAEEHTARYYREELWLPELFERRQPMVGTEVHVDNTCEKAKKKVRELLDMGMASKLSREQTEEMDNIMKEAEKKL